MKKTAIIASFFALFTYFQPVSAHDIYGNWDDPIFDWGAGSDDIIIWGDEPDYDDIIATAMFFLWEAPEYIELPNWFYEYYDSYYYHYNGSGPGSGNNGGGKVTARQNSLPPNAQALLELKMLQMLQYCAYQAMLDHITSDGSEFYDVRFSSSVAVGGYNACIGELLFNNINSINEAFPEEFIHFFQNHYYPGGICQYWDSNVHNNIEFEAKLMQDLINYIAMNQGYTMGGGNLGTGPSLGSIYTYWINYLTNGGTSMPTFEKLFESFQSYNYWNFMNDWATGYLYGVHVNPNFGPQSIGYLSGICD